MPIGPKILGHQKFYGTQIQTSTKSNLTELMEGNKLLSLTYSIWFWQELKLKASETCQKITDKVQMKAQVQRENLDFKIYIWLALIN